MKQILYQNKLDQQFEFITIVLSDIAYEYFFIIIILDLIPKQKKLSLPWFMVGKQQNEQISLKPIEPVLLTTQMDIRKIVI